MKTAGLGSAGRPSDRRQQTRNLVLDAALRLFSEHGYLGVRVEDIAKRAGVSRATFYKHFAEREQILAELFERLLGPESETIPPPAGDLGGFDSTEVQVTAVVEAAVRRILEQEQLARFVYSLPVRHGALLGPGARTIPPVFTQVTQLLEAAAQQGSIRQDVPTALLARHVLEAMETAMRDWAEGRVGDPVAHVKLMLSLALHGLTKR